MLGTVLLAAACSGVDPAARGRAEAGTTAADTAAETATTVSGADPGRRTAATSTTGPVTPGTTSGPAATPTTGPGEPGTTSGPDAASRRPVLRFAGSGSATGWTSVDDTVMGGRSDSTVAWRDGALVFAGTVSLENNGGFSSARSPFDPAIGSAMGDATELLLDAAGDGKTYVLQLRSQPSGRALHIARFSTTAGTAETHVLRLDRFEPVGFRLDRLPGAPGVDPAAVVQVSLYVLDKQAGPFSLAIRSLDAR